MKPSVTDVLKKYMADFSSNTSVPQKTKAIYAFVALNNQKVWVGTTGNATKRLQLKNTYDNRINNRAQFPDGFIPYITKDEEIRFFVDRRYSAERLTEIKDALAEHGYLINKGRRLHR